MGYKYRELTELEEDLKDGRTDVVVQIPPEDLLRYMGITAENAARVDATPPFTGTLGRDPENGAICIRDLKRPDGAGTGWCILLRDEDAVVRFEVSVPDPVYLSEEEACALYEKGSTEEALVKAYYAYSERVGSRGITKGRVEEIVSMLKPEAISREVKKPLLIVVLGGLTVVEDDGVNKQPIRY